MFMEVVNVKVVLRDVIETRELRRELVREEVLVDILPVDDELKELLWKRNVSVFKHVYRVEKLARHLVVYRAGRRYMYSIEEQKYVEVVDSGVYEIVLGDNSIYYDSSSRKFFVEVYVEVKCMNGVEAKYYPSILARIFSIDGEDIGGYVRVLRDVEGGFICSDNVERIELTREQVLDLLR